MSNKTIATATAHSALGASTMKRWENCPGSVALSAPLPPRPQSPEAAEGTTAHAAAEHFLLKGELPKNCSAEMAEAVMVYINTIFEDERAAYPISGVQSFTEVRLDLSQIKAGMFGTADRVAIFPSQKLMRVYDYKHGVGQVVEVENNEQLMYYGLGALLQFRTQFQIVEVELVIVQPRAHHKDGPVRRWKTTAHELQTTFAKRLLAAATATTHPNAPLKPGSWCRWCPAAGICPKIQEKALAAAQNEFKPQLSYNPQTLSDTLELLPVIAAWMKGVEEFAEAEMKNGKAVPGFKLVAGRGSRAWREGTDPAMIELETGLPNDKLFSKPEFLSVAKVEKLLTKDEKALLSPYVVKTPGALTIAPESDPRPAARIEAAVEFTKIPESIDDFM